MEEFMSMIYDNWAEQSDDRDLFMDKGKELIDRLENILSFDLNNEIYGTFCDSCLEVEKNAFIAGFSYATKCLSAGKIDLSVTK